MKQDGKGETQSVYRSGWAMGSALARAIWAVEQASAGYGDSINWTHVRERLREHGVDGTVAISMGVAFAEQRDAEDD